MAQYKNLFIRTSKPTLPLSFLKYNIIRVFCLSNDSARKGILIRNVNDDDDNDDDDDDDDDDDGDDLFAFQFDNELTLKCAIR